MFTGIETTVVTRFSGATFAANGLHADSNFTARAMVVDEPLDLRDGTVIGELRLEEAAIGEGSRWKAPSVGPSAPVRLTFETHN